MCLFSSLQLFLDATFGCPPVCSCLKSYCVHSDAVLHAVNVMHKHFFTTNGVFNPNIKVADGPTMTHSHIMQGSYTANWLVIKPSPSLCSMDKAYRVSVSFSCFIYRLLIDCLPFYR